MHGPCAISSESDTDCPASADYPLTKYEYYPDWLANVSLRNRLKAVRVQGTRLGGLEWLLSAGAFVSIVIPLIVFFSLQRYFVRGLLAGSVKG